MRSIVCRFGFGAFLALLSAALLLGQGAQLPKYTVATLPSPLARPTYTVQVIDGATASDCTVGGGKFNVICVASAASLLTINCSVVNGGNSLNGCQTQAGVVAGMSVTGPGLAPSTTVTGLIGSNQIGISPNAIATSAGTYGFGNGAPAWVPPSGPPVAPNTILWPSSCNTATGVYNFTTNSCIDLAAQTFTAGTTTTLPPGSNATFTVTGAYPNYAFNFGIPTGIPGGSLSYPGVVSDGANGLIVQGAVNAANRPAPAANSIRASTSNNTNGNPQPQQVIALLGNSLVQVDTGFIFEFCGEAGSSGFSSVIGPFFAAGHQCRFATNVTVDSSNNVTLVVNNADGYFQNGSRFTAYAGASIAGGCLFDSYTVTTATATSIVFPTAGSGQTCTPLASTPITAANLPLTTSVQKFGQNGGTLDSWYASAGPYGFAGYKAWVQGAIAAGQTPITVMADAGIMTNTTRLSQFDYRGWMADLMPKVASIEGITATNPAGATVSVASFPFFIATGNPNACDTTTTGVFSDPCSGGANTGTGGVYVPPVKISGSIQYVFPYGTTGSFYTTPATITSGAISAGLNTVTINPCPPDLWGGPGDTLPTSLDANGLLRRHGNLVQMVIDTAASNAQEVVSLTAIAPTGATGLHNFQTCQITFTSAFAHAANASIVSTELTADQTWTGWKLEIPYDVVTAFPGNVQAIDTLSSIGRQVSNPVNYLANELHPAGAGFGYSLIAARILAAIASYQAVPRPPPTPDPLIYEGDTLWTTQKTPAIDIGFDPNVAIQARIAAANGLNCGAFYSKCNIDPSFFYPTIVSKSVVQTNATLLSVQTPAFSGQPLAADAQTGDYLYSNIGGSWQPTTMSAGYFNPNVEGINITGTPSVTPGGRIGVMRPYYVDAAQGSKFAAHPTVYPLNSTYNLKVGTSSTNNLVFSISIGQNPQIIGGENLTCYQIEMQTGDYIIVAGNLPGGTPAAGTLITLPAGGSWNQTTCTWTDTSSTNYATYNGRMANLVQQNRPPDATFTQAMTRANMQVQGKLTASTGVTASPTPAYTLPTINQLRASTGGNCQSGTSYVLGAAFEPITYGTDFTHAGPITPSVTTVSGLSGSTNQIQAFPNSGTVPYGYQIVMYLQISGTYYAIGSALAINSAIATGCPATGAGLIPANITDQGTTGFTGGPFNPTVLQTTVNCATSGTAVFSQPLAGASDKKVLVHLAACNGNASYTYPVPFTNIPGIFASYGLTAAMPGLIPSNTTTGVIVSGSTSTGTIVLEDY